MNTVKKQIRDKDLANSEVAQRGVPAKSNSRCPKRTRQGPGMPSSIKESELFSIGCSQSISLATAPSSEAPVPLVQ